MAPKNSKNLKNSTAKGKVQEDEKEEVLQAVVIADTFESKFTPFTLEKPRCLLPLVNTPIIEYTLEFLARSGVQEVFLSAGPQTEQVENYIDASRWRSKSSPFKKVHFLKSAAMSVGDVMRDLDQKGLVTGDFLVVAGDVVSNLPIADAMTKHKARRLKDKNAIMTMLLREAGPSQPMAERSRSPVFVIDPIKSRCLHFEDQLPARSTEFSVDPEMLMHAELEIRQDLTDCRIDICCPEVLSLWSDNFDNQSPRKDFLRGILKDYELNGKTVHTHIFSDYFVGRVSDLSAYERLSSEICARWSFPECPQSRNRYRFTRPGFHQGDGVVLARSCRVGTDSIIGQGTKIGEKSSVHKSVIGRHCRIGRNVELRHAYVWDHAVIDDDARILHAIVADGATVGANCRVQNGSLLSFGIRLDPGRVVDNASKITRIQSDSAGSELADKNLVGENGEGYLWTDEEDELVETDPRISGLVYQNQDFASSESSVASVDSDEATDPSRFKDSRSESFATTMSDEDSTDRFHHEAVVSLFERMKKGTEQDDVHVELMGLRFAQNASGFQVRRAVAVALMKYISHQVEWGKIPIPEAVKQSVIKYRKLIRRDENQETASAQVDFLLEAQKDLVHRIEGDQILLHLVKQLYDQDMFEEEVISEWWSDDRGQSTGELQRIRHCSKQFMDWLADAEEESDSESDGE